jgi:hypothetical protein
MPREGQLQHGLLTTRRGLKVDTPGEGGGPTARVALAGPNLRNGLRGDPRLLTLVPVLLE